MEYINRVRAKLDKSIGEYFRGKHTEHVRYFSYASLVVFVSIIVIYNGILSAPSLFPAGTLVSVEKGMTLRDVGDMLEDRNVVRSGAIFSAFVRFGVGERGALSGDYYFSIPETMLGVVRRITRGEYGLEPIRITIPEGATIDEIGDVLAGKIPSFPKERFIDIARDKEGFLFPDTYFFLPNAEPEQIIRVMEENFSIKVGPLSKDILASGNTLEDIITMASIIEKEAIVEEDKKMVSGILWKRIKIGMPLQVDAPFIYERNKNTFQLTVEDLREDSPYNTYTNKGLTPTPIANPGIESIVAALAPLQSQFFFYLSDKNGVMHYGATFEEHRRNKALYLN